MLSKGKKAFLLIIGIFSILLAIVSIIPWRTIFVDTSVYQLELLIKLIILPSIIILISIYPNVLKYQQVISGREQSKVVSLISYFPIISYLSGLIVFILYMLTKGYGPLGISSWALWFVTSAVVLALLLFLSHVFVKLEMKLGLFEHIILDCCMVLSLLCFIFICSQVSEAYKLTFTMVKPQADPILLVIYILTVIWAIVHVVHLSHIVVEDEINLNVQMDDIDAESEYAHNAEYNRAYNDILDDFEGFFDDLEIAEPKPAQESAQQASADQSAAEEFYNALLVELRAVRQELSEVKVALSQYQVQPVQAVPQKIVETVTIPVDEAEILKVDAEKAELEAEKAKLEQQQADYEAKMAALEALKHDVATKEEILANQPVVVEKPKKEIPPKTFKPSYRTVLNYAKGLTGINVVENEKQSSAKFMIGKKVFLITNDTPRDYRFTFLADLNEVVYMMTKYPSIVKAKTPKGDNWFKLVNKGEFTEEDLFALIDKAYAMIGILDAAKKAEKAEARKLAKAQANDSK